MTLRVEPAAPWPRVKHSTTEPLRPLPVDGDSVMIKSFALNSQKKNGTLMVAK